MTIDRWVLVDIDGIEEEHEYELYDEAEAEASRRHMAVVERHYTFDDSELVWTPDGGSRWPPGKGLARRIPKTRKGDRDGG